MPTLVKDRNWYYVQFYDKERKPKRKRVSLKTKQKKVAQHLHRKLEEKYALGQFDAWTGFDATETQLSLSKNSTLEQVMEYYITLKQAQDWRSETSKNTSYVLRHFGRERGLQRHIRSLDINEVNSFLNRSGIAYATRRSHKTKLSPFIKWCAENKLVQCDPSQIKIYNKDHEQKETISYLSDSEIVILQLGIRQKVEADIIKGYQTKERNALWLIDLIDWQRWSGMRISETLSLTPENFNLETWEITIGSNSFTTKSKAKQILPIQHVTPLKELAKKLLLNSKNNQPLFGHTDAKRTSRTFKKYLRMFLPNREEINLHSLRHTCCINLLRKGVPIYTVQRWMRHSSVSTTQNYADLLSIDISKQIGLAVNS